MPVCVRRDTFSITYRYNLKYLNCSSFDLSTGIGCKHFCYVWRDKNVRHKCRKPNVQGCRGAVTDGRSRRMMSYAAGDCFCTSGCCAARQAPGKEAASQAKRERGGIDLTNMEMRRAQNPMILKARLQSATSAGQGALSRPGGQALGAP